jgi:hypothetical protein
LKFAGVMLVEGDNNVLNFVAARVRPFTPCEVAVGGIILQTVAVVGEERAALWLLAAGLSLSLGDVAGA